MINEKIIIDMLNRICKLEEQVEQLLEEKENSKMGTADVRNYIVELKNQHKINGDKFFCVTANEVHKALKLKNRMPIVCNAMKQTMEMGDEIIHQTASGYSSTFAVKYYL